jgi:hypothetical protein
MSFDNQLAVGLLLVAGGFIAYYVMQQDKNGDEMSEFEVDIVNAKNTLEGKLTRISGEYDYMVIPILDNYAKSDDYQYLDVFQQYHPDMAKILTDFKVEVRRLQGDLAQIKGRSGHISMLLNYNWEKDEDFLNELEHAVDDFRAKMSDAQQHRDVSYQVPQEIKIQNIFYQQEIFNQQQQFVDQRQQRVNFLNMNFQQNIRHEAPMQIDGGEPDLYQAPPISGGVSGNDYDERYLPQYNLPRILPTPPREDASSGFDQGASNKAKINRGDTKPPQPPKMKGNWGSLTTEEMVVPKRLKSVEYYVKICSVVHSNIIKRCQTSMGGTRRTQSEMVKMYKKLSKNFFFLDLAIKSDPEGRKPKDIEGVLDVLGKCQRIATHIYDIFGFDVHKGFSESHYAKPPPTKEREVGEKGGRPSPTKSTENMERPAKKKRGSQLFEQLENAPLTPKKATPPLRPKFQSSPSKIQFGGGGDSQI